MSTPQRSRLQQLLAKTPPGKRIDGILAIAMGPAPTDATQPRYARALIIKDEYESAAALPLWKQLIKLRGLFDATEKFYKDFPEVHPAS